MLKEICCQIHMAWLLVLLATSSQALGQTKQSQTLRILTANSISNDALFKTLSKEFNRLYPNINVEVSSGGGLAILQAARKGEADLVVTHLPQSEKVFIADGFGVSRTLIMYNEFVLLGPPTDELGIHQERDLHAVLRKLASNEVPFFLPSKRSGTYKKMDELWAMVGITPDWVGYESTGATSVTTLIAAAEFGVYTFADFASFLSRQKAIQDKLVPIYRDHYALRNNYHAIVVSAKKFPHVNQQLAQQFVDLLVSDTGQDIIRRVGVEKYGTPIFTPAAHLDPGLKQKRELQQRSNIIIAMAIVLSCLAILSTFIIILLRRTHHSEQKHKLSEERFELAVAGSSDGIWDWRIQEDIAYFSPRMNYILGLDTSNTSITQPANILPSLVHPQDLKELIYAFRRYLSVQNTQTFTAEFRILKKDQQEEQWIMLRGKVLRDKNDAPVRMSGSVTDITSVIQQQAEIEHQALHDSLTNLPNRNLLLDRTEQEIKNSKRQQVKFAVIMIDLDRFKVINDTLGHPVGDEVLKQVAYRLQCILRSTDTIARLGGDEFAIILPEATELYANHICQKILLALKRVVEIDHLKLYIGASLGISIYPEHGDNTHTLIQHADVAMYVAKREGTGLSMYNSKQDYYSVRRLMLEKDLHDAVLNKNLTLQFQPKVDLNTKSVNGVEALLRWQHEELGHISPEEIIEIAEQTGLIKQLTNFIIDTALKHNAEWRSQGIELPVAVNLSTLNLHDPQLISYIKDTLQHWKIQPNQLELEITESAMMVDTDRAVDILQELDKLNVQLTIDDFGTGFSSLAYLKKLPVDYIKIDRSFIIGMLNDKNDNSIVRSTIELAHNLDMMIIAEGIDNQRTLEELVRLGCDIAQGFYFSQPLDSNALVTWLLKSPWGLSFEHLRDNKNLSKQSIFLH